MSAFDEIPCVWSLHCVTDYYAQLLFCCKPEYSSKFRPILDTRVALANFHGDEAKKYFKMAVFQNGHFSKSPILKTILWKFHGLVWVSRIYWCKGHWCSSIYMVVRLSDVSSKTGKKCIFCVFRLFLLLRQTASRPYRLSYISALCINQSY